MSKQIKIILFRGGFAGDLITALHDMACFKKLEPNGQVMINRNRKILQLDFKKVVDENSNSFEINTCTIVLIISKFYCSISLIYLFTITISYCNQARSHSSHHFFLCTRQKD